MKCKKLATLLAAITASTSVMAQAWPTAYQGVMLQGFSWNSYDATNWKNLESQADELSQYFKLIWIPQSGNCGGESMGYDDLYWFDNYKSAFGSEDELRSMIKTFKQKGLGTIADVVINHRKTLTNYVDFPKETYKGNTYQLLSTDICANDCGGTTAKWAQQNGYQLSGHNDTGDGVDFARDLDHKSPNVQKNVKAYLDFLLNDLGYTGVRYDMVKGYSAEFTGMYNADAKVQYSVGEYFDYNKQLVINWMNGTKVNGTIQSGAFDFPLRNAIRSAANNNSWSDLSWGGLATDATYNRYAVTFVENHDTQVRSASEQQDPVRTDTLAANAFMLAMPGTPCVFLPHWIDCKADIKNMILVRNMVGINNQSAFTQNASLKRQYVATVTGTNGKLMVVVGPTATDYIPAGNNWVMVLDGKNYRYFVEKKQEKAWTSLPSGTYYNKPTATLRVLSATDGAKIVYTTDGTNPTASSTAVANGATIKLPEGQYTMKMALLQGGKVWGQIERQYDVRSFKAYPIVVNVNVEQVGWSNMNVWSWGGDGSHNNVATKWPGDAVSTTKQEGGKKWYSLNYTMNTVDDYVNFVFSTKEGNPQTENIQNVKQTSYFVVTTNKDSQGHYKVQDVTSQYTTGIEAVVSNCSARPTRTLVTTLDGRTLRSYNAEVSIATATQGLPHGIYIVGGRKVVK